MELIKENDKYQMMNDSTVIATLNFTKLQDHIISIDSIETEFEYRGLGLARKLIYELAQDARLNNDMLQPNCECAVQIFNRFSDIHDVLNK